VTRTDLPPRFSQWLLRWCLPGNATGRTILSELLFEYRFRLSTESVAGARAWYRRQAISISLRALRDAVAGRPWGRRHKDERSRMRVLDNAVRDVALAIRSIPRRPVYAGTIIVTLALAIGANAAVFSVINSVILQPLPYPASNQLVSVGRGVQIGNVSYPDFRDWRSGATTLASFAAYTLARETFVAEDLAEEWTGVETTPALFEVLGTPPLLGRTLLDGIDVPGTDALVISHRLWQRRFGGDSSVVGRRVRFEDVDRVIVGVMPPDFYFPTPTAEYWAAISSGPFFGQDSYLESRDIWFLQTVGRLAPGHTTQEVERQIDAVATAIDASAEGAVDADETTRVHVVRYHENVVGDTRPLFWLLAGAVAVVLAIACANIANLTLAQATERRQEFATRIALGAGTVRLAGQTVTEHVVLALIGGGLGFLIAQFATDVLVAIGPVDLPRRHEIGVDGVVFGFTCVLAILCGMVAGTIPVWRHSRMDVCDGLRDGGRAGIGRGGARLMSGLAVFQIALAVVLTIGAGLLLNSFARLSAVQPGFDVDHSLTMQLQLPRSRYGNPTAIARYYDDVRERLMARSRIREVAYTSTLPFSGAGLSLAYFLEGETADAEHESVQLEVVEGDYFEAMGISILAGRSFNETERREGPPNIVINRAMADLHWRGRSPIDQRFTFDSDFSDDHWMTIVGVVDNVLKSSLGDVPGPVAYLTRHQFSNMYSFVSGRNGYLVIQTDANPGDMIEPVLEGLRSVDPHVPFTEIRTARALVASSVTDPRFRSVLIGSFAAVATAVALVGIYGLLAFSVAQRSHEFGVRMALGADAPRVVRHVVRQGGRLVAVGLPLGVVGAVIAGRALEATLYHITAADPATLVAAAAGFGAPGERGDWIHW
jgi:putative ABC transport system permease protein